MLEQKSARASVVLLWQSGAPSLSALDPGTGAIPSIDELHLRTTETRRTRSPQSLNIEVDQKSSWHPLEMHIRHQLRAMDRQELVNRLDFHDQDIVNQ
jgi:hypothetical protein